MEDLRIYLQEFVEPTIAEFERDPSSVRLAFIACVVTFHSVDYLAHPRKSAALRETWNRTSDAFKMVDQIAHAFKHVKARKRDTVLNASEVVAVGSFSRGFSPGFDLARVTLESDPTVDVLTTVKEAAAFIERQLQQPDGSHHRHR
jgi:hypothetical protein